VTPFPLYALAGVALVAIGLHGLFACVHLLRRILAVNIIGGGVFLVFGAVAARDPASGPDPVPHAMVITGIVVAVSATAFALVLAWRIHRATGRSTLAEDDPSPGA